MRAVAGSARYPSPPEPGTIVGPNAFGEHLVVVGTEGGVTTFSYVTTDDVTASLEREPQSVAEVGMR